MAENKLAERIKSVCEPTVQMENGKMYFKNNNMQHSPSFGFYRVEVPQHLQSIFDKLRLQPSQRINDQIM